MNTQTAQAKFGNEAEYVRARTDGEILAIIRSTNPAGDLRAYRVAAIDEWDRRHPVGGK